MAGPDVDVVITEVGGTVGDIESLPFLEAIRQIRHEIGRDHCFFLHVSLLPYIGPSGELKTKPTQHSVAALRSIGIQPDAIVCRSDRPISGGLKRKISADVRRRRGGGGRRRRTPRRSTTSPRCCTPRAWTPTWCAGSACRSATSTGRDWDDAAAPGAPARPTAVTIALVGKYVDLPDAYLSPAEALRAGGFANDARVNIRWVTSDDCQTPEGAARQLDGVDGVLVPGGFGVRGIEGKIGAVRYARENGIPLLGLCLGLQCMVIEVGRRPGRPGRGQQRRVRPGHAAPGDRHDGRPGGRRGRGAGHGRHHAARPLPGRAGRGQPGPRAVRRPTWCEERHRHRYEVNNAYRDALEEAGLVCSGLSPDGRLVEFVELPRDVHPFFVGHPGAPGVPVPARPGRTRCSAGWSPPRWSAPGGSRAGAADGAPAAGRLRARDRPRTALITASGAVPDMTRCSGRGGLVRDIPSTGRWPRRRAGRVAGTAAHRHRCGCPTARRPAGTSSSTPARSRVLALDEAGRVLLIRQYRHPVGRLLWEIPAGLRDVAGRAAAGDRRARADGGGRLPGRRTGRCSSTSSPRRVSAPSGSDLPRPRPQRGPGGRARVRSEHEEAHLMVGLGAAGRGASAASGR